MPARRPRDGPRGGGLALTSRYAAAGLQVGASVVGGLLLGMLVDRWLGTAPWLGVAGLLVGAVGGFLELFRALRRWEREDASVSTPDRSSGPSSPSGSA
jgi:F0F1-type ATP synthase assembly protein I